METTSIEPTSVWHIPEKKLIGIALIGGSYGDDSNRPMPIFSGQFPDDYDTSGR